MHTTYIMHKWGGMRLRRVVLDSYVRIPTFVAWEMSNDKYTILESLKKKKTNKGALMSSKNQTDKGDIMSLKGYIYISMVSI